MRQLALPFLHRTPACADVLAAPSNEAARVFLAADPRSWPFGRLSVWGPAGCGKTHLLHRWAGERSGVVLEAGAIARVAGDGVLPAARGIGIDDADQVGDEIAFLHVINVAAEHGVPLVLASRCSPARWPVGLPDLSSRLRATLAVAIEPPEDRLLDALIGRLIADRQLAVSPSVVRYLRLRLPREPGALRDAVARLDEASLAGHRAVSLALASDLFGDGSASLGSHGSLR